MTSATWLEVFPVALLGLLIGSFLNVVIFRLPKMMQAQWRRECQQLSDPHSAGESEPRYNLLVPRSACPHCGHQIRWYENLPLLSFALLRGQCGVCAAPIGLRYPLVEAATGIAMGYCAARWGWTVQTAIWSAFCAALIALALIDWDTTLLPDDITLPLLWLGLIVAALEWNTQVKLSAALWGAVAGYVSLWTVFWLFKLVTGKEGMGYGDFKLFAALGAWMGWQALIPMILLASVIGAVVGIAMKMRNRLAAGGYIPFGPFLVGAGFVSLVFGPASILRFIGL